MNQRFPVSLRTLHNRRFAVLALVAAAILLFNASTAKAGCGDPRKGQLSPFPTWLSHHDGSDYDGSPTIVGLWHTHYTTSESTPFIESFKTWHSDGTEFENAFLPPIGGNVCFGVWKEYGRNTVKLHHVGLMFNPDGSIKATFTVDEIDTVSNDNKTYKGSFTFITYAPNGTPSPAITGTIEATRITVD